MARRLQNRGGDSGPSKPTQAERDMAKTPKELAEALEEKARESLKIAPGIPGSIGLREAAEQAKRASDAWLSVEHCTSDTAEGENATKLAAELLDKSAVTMASAYQRSGDYRDVARAAELAFWAAEIGTCDSDRQGQLYEMAYRLARKAGYEAHKLGLPE